IPKVKESPRNGSTGRDVSRPSTYFTLRPPSSSMWAVLTNSSEVKPGPGPKTQKPTVCKRRQTAAGLAPGYAWTTIHPAVCRGEEDAIFSNYRQSFSNAIVSKSCGATHKRFGGGNGLQRS